MVERVNQIKATCGLVSKPDRKMSKANVTKTVLVVSSGQYETCAIKVVVRHTTESGLMRRARQLAREHAVYGDNWAGWINANVAISSKGDEWGDNQIIGGRWCNPANGWMEL